MRYNILGDKFFNQSAMFWQVQIVHSSKNIKPPFRRTRFARHLQRLVG